MLKNQQLPTWLQKIIKLLDRLARVGDTTEGPDADNRVNGSGGDFVIGELFHTTGCQKLSGTQPERRLLELEGTYKRSYIYH